jgi:hypothetical protein
MLTMLYKRELSSTVVTVFEFNTGRTFGSRFRDKLDHNRVYGLGESGIGIERLIKHDNPLSNIQHIKIMRILCFCIFVK